ncbi:RNA polymerase sigma-70 factor (ECF subfamily) [Constrictibacter sp. MBR-5]|jgi:RNA polymerase sigma-70 factor (ECF subfamily)
MGRVRDGTTGQFDYAGAIGRCASGDRAALEALFAVEAGRLLAVAKRFLHRRDLAEEAVQDAFIQIWRKAGTFDPALGSGRGWIYAIVRNRALNMLRDGAREDLVGDEHLAAWRDGESTTRDAFERLPLESRLRRCLEGLDAEKRSSILMSYVAGYSHGEIAGRLAVPLGTAKAWVRRGLAALRECMS